MTLTWCSVHALKNKVLLKTPPGSLILLKNKIYINLKPSCSISELYIIVHKHSQNSHNNHLRVIFGLICLTVQFKNNVLSYDKTA